MKVFICGEGDSVIAGKNPLEHGLANFSLLFKRFYLFLQRVDGRERNIELKEEHRSVASCTYPKWGPNLQRRQVP